MIACQKPDQSDLLCWSKSPKHPKFGVNKPAERHSSCAACSLQHWYAHDNVTDAAYHLLVVSVNQ